LGIHHTLGLSKNLFAVAVTIYAQGAGTGGRPPHLSLTIPRLLIWAWESAVSWVLPSLPAGSKVNGMGPYAEDNNGILARCRTVTGLAPCLRKT